MSTVAAHPIKSCSRTYTFGAEALDGLAQHGAFVTYTTRPLLPNKKRRAVSVVYEFPCGERLVDLEFTQFARDEDALDDLLDANMTFYRSSAVEFYANGDPRLEYVYEGAPRSHGIRITLHPVIRKRGDVVKLPKLPAEKHCEPGFSVKGSYRGIPVTLLRADRRSWQVYVHPADGSEPVFVRSNARRVAILKDLADYVQHALSARFL